jgi:hypothetical protein
MEPIAEVCGDLADVWRLWWDQQLNPSCQLWSLSITAWGRVGKLLGAAGFMAVIVEIIGPKKLKEWGERLLERVYGTYGSTWLPWFTARPKVAMILASGTLIVGLMGSGALWVAYKWWTTWGAPDAGLWQAAFFISAMLLLMIAALVGTVSWTIFTLSFIVLPSITLSRLVGGVVLTLIAIALSHNQLGPLIKEVTLIILLVGLFLDLLSS